MLADLAGRDVVTFDLFGDLDVRASRVVTAGGLRALVDAAVAEPAGSVVYGASFENHPALVARLAERHTLLGNPPDTLRAVRDPARLAAVVPDFPRTSLTASVDRSRRWLRKPLRGGGGTRVRNWRGGALPAGTYLQERIDGLPCSAAAVADGVDAVVLGVTEQLVGRREFGVRGYRWCGNITPPRLEPEALLLQARAICSRVGARSRSGACSASTSSGTAGARGRSRSTHAPPPRSSSSPAWTPLTRTCAAAPESCRASRLRRAPRAKPSCSPPRT